MSAKEVYAGEAQAEGLAEERRGSGRRFVVILTLSILLLFALTVLGLYTLFSAKLKQKARPQNPTAEANAASAATESESYRWKIAGALWTDLL